MDSILLGANHSWIVSTPKLKEYYDMRLGLYMLFTMLLVYLICET